MKTIQSLLAVAGIVGAVSAWGSGWSNETTVWTTVTTDVSPLSEQQLPIPRISQGVSTVSPHFSHEELVTLAPLLPPRACLFESKANAEIKVYTTYCPESTTFTQGTKTYTATASETLTITGEHLASPDALNMIANVTSRLPMHLLSHRPLGQANHYSSCSSPTTSIQRHLGSSRLGHHD
jgi:hypothetical protein